MYIYISECGIKTFLIGLYGIVDALLSHLSHRDIGVSGFYCGGFTLHMFISPGGRVIPN